MPGGNKYRQWYAMRQRLITEGRWTSTRREIRVPPAKQARLDDSSPDTSPSMPDLESSDSDPEGMFVFFYRCLHKGGLVLLDLLFFFGASILLLNILKRRTYY